MSDEEAELKEWAEEAVAEAAALLEAARMHCGGGDLGSEQVHRLARLAAILQIGPTTGAAVGDAILDAVVAAAAPAPATKPAAKPFSLVTPKED